MQDACNTQVDSTAFLGERGERGDALWGPPKMILSLRPQEVAQENQTASGNVLREHVPLPFSFFFPA